MHPCSSHAPGLLTSCVCVLVCVLVRKRRGKHSCALRMRRARKCVDARHEHMHLQHPCARRMSACAPTCDQRAGITHVRQAILTPPATPTRHSAHMSDCLPSAPPRARRPFVALTCTGHSEQMSRSNRCSSAAATTPLWASRAPYAATCHARVRACGCLVYGLCVRACVRACVRE